MKPDAVVIMSGRYAQAEVFDPVFGLDDWEPTVAPTRFKRSSDLQTFLVHTYHPERKKGSREMAETIASLIKSNCGHT